jgi:hypothetical protein
MAVETRTESKLERAYVESKVIRAGLDHLAARLDTADEHLRGGLQECTERFDAYMRELHDVYRRAAAPARR